METERAKHNVWPVDHTISAAAFARVNTTVSCILTRFHLSSPLFLLPFYLHFRRVRRDARHIEGLLRAVFLMEDSRTCYTLSLWSNDAAIVEFGTVKAHVYAARSAFGPTYRKDLDRAEIWSAQFRLWAISSHNLNWDGLDLQSSLRREKRQREEFV